MFPDHCQIWLGSGPVSTTGRAETARQEKSVQQDVRCLLITHLTQQHSPQSHLIFCNRIELNQNRTDRPHPQSRASPIEIIHNVGVFSDININSCMFNRHGWMFVVKATSTPGTRMGQRNIFDGLVLPPVRVLFYVLKTLLKLWLPALIKAPPPNIFQGQQRCWMAACWSGHLKGSAWLK